jgi:ATP-dependent Clp protease ATP-binding subunit ClpA
VKITVPIYIQKLAQREATPPTHILRPLFHPHVEAHGEDLNRAMTKLAQLLRRECDRLGTEMRHDLLAAYAFSPDLEDHFYKFDFEMANHKERCNLLVVAFRSLGRKLAFTPSLPDLWFEIHRGETLADRAAEVLSHYFREKEKRHGKDARPPQHYSIDGKAWVTTLEISIQPPVLAQPPKANLFAMLGGGEKMHGAEELEKTGRCLDYLYPDDLSRVIYREQEVAELTAILRGKDQRPVLLIGQRLVGKTAIIHEYVYRTVGGRHSKFSANNKVWLLSPQRLLSGMAYVGQWENRLLAILKEAKKRDHILYFDDLLGLYQAGQTSNSTLSVADVLKPYVEKRTHRLLGEITPEAFRVLQERDRSFADSFHLLSVKEPDEDKSFRILLHLMRQLERQHRCAFTTDVFPTVMDLQRRYARDAAFPGKAAVFLHQLAVKFRNERVTREDVLKQFHAKSGLALTFLNDNTKLQRQEVAQAISKEVVGQDAALEACADVVALAKARLTDTDRPLASFLFLGPTGVGKTQCAKSLASYLFSDAEKILRFDMNEYASAYAAARLVGTFNQPEGLLTGAVRRQPFSVVLLDEIEKAHPDVFNLLLQVMGDGRLTDALGRTVDFTNAILILTSNLGVREAAKNVGFRQDEARESQVYIQAAERFFKPEFFNRLDRIVPFERLTRKDVKQIAQGLMQSIFAREGLVRRKCILQVEESAFESIIDAGFDPQLGARALKRMLERQLTQPVATRLAILKPEAPTLISVRQADEKLEVTVSAMQGAEPCDQIKTALAGIAPRRIVDLVEAAIERLEAGIAPLRPEGLINADRIAAEHLAYFQIREQQERVREMCRRSVSRIGRARSNAPSRARGRKISASQFTLRQTHVNDLWQRIVTAADLHALLKDVATDAQPHGERVEESLAELLRECALLETLARVEQGRAGDRVAILIRSMIDAGKTERERLAKAYATLFEYKMGMSVRRLPDFEPISSLNAEALVISGVNAATIALCEAGTHLFYSAHDSLLPLQVEVLPLSEGEVMEVLGTATKQSEPLRRAKAEAGDLPPVIRVYETDGATLDLRSGLMTLKAPTAEELRALLLAGLPLPSEITKELN